MQEVDVSLFQFQYGLIKRIQYQYNPQLHRYFNSNMVWLKDRNVYLQNEILEFQFQYGLIKSFR